jgi:hypothetical protein
MGGSWRDQAMEMEMEMERWLKVNTTRTAQ